MLKIGIYPTFMVILQSIRGNNSLFFFIHFGQPGTNNLIFRYLPAVNNFGQFRFYLYLCSRKLNKIVMKISYEELVKYLKEKDADYDEISQPLYNINNISEWVYDISGTWLDWKHGWGYLRWCMEQIEYVEIFNKVTEEDGSDCWSGVSRFVLKEVVEFYNKKQNEKAE